MHPVDWNAPAKLMERQDSGSELYYEFTAMREAALGALVRDVFAMPATERARLIIDAGGQGTFNIGEIMKLSERIDFPA